MNDTIPAETQGEIQTSTVKSLHEQRLDLRMRLQLNRRLLAHKLIGSETENHYPRSATMRFLSRQSTHQLIKKAANAALGIQTIRSLHYGYSFVKFIRNAFSSHKKIPD
ncbi:MAG: hypothetical protein EOO68_00325 [Moraxellaceae bacterium]|nr:MAG: hypothetical protein EOO68_00325 [Moraxellaceae bacterium]